MTPKRKTKTKRAHKLLVKQTKYAKKQTKKFIKSKAGK